METLKIEIPMGYEIDTFDKITGEIRFKQAPKKSVIERIKTIDDVLQALSDKDADVVIYRKLLTVLDIDSYVVNNQLAVLITKALNEGWVPDWSNPNEYKYFPWFEMGSSGFRFFDHGDWCSSVGSRLCFKSSELAQYAGRTFQNVYEKFMLIK